MFLAVSATYKTTNIPIESTFKKFFQQIKYLLCGMLLYVCMHTIVSTCIRSIIICCVNYAGILRFVKNLVIIPTNIHNPLFAYFTVVSN